MKLVSHHTRRVLAEHVSLCRRARQRTMISMDSSIALLSSALPSALTQEDALE